MIDIHCHIMANIPGDDGSKSMTESLAIGRKLAKAGFKHVFATPHCIEGEVENNFVEMDEQLKSLNKVFKENNIELQVHLGCEILFHNEVLARIKSGKAVTLGGSRYALIELPMRELPEATLDLMNELKQNEILTVIAHPERNRVISANPTEIASLLDQGALLQLNLCSLVGVYGETAQKTAEMLIKAKAYHFIGTDLHNDRLDIERALQRLYELTEETYYQQITTGFPTAILENSIIEHKVDMDMLRPVIKIEEIKSKGKKRKVGRTILVAITLLAVITSGGLVYADYKIQQELEQAFEGLAVDESGNINLEALMNPDPKGQNTNTGQADSNSATASDSSGSGTTETTDSANTNQQGNGNGGTNGGVGTSNHTENTSNQATGESSTTSKASSAINKLTLPEKAKAYSIVMGKLTPDLVNRMKALAADGFTAEEKKEIKQVFYTNFTAEEQRFLMDLYLKGK